jgi:hypothetical protein
MAKAMRPRERRRSKLGKAVGRDGWKRQEREMSKDDDADKFHKRKTQKSWSEETRGLVESDRSKEGSLIGGQSLQAQELGDGLATGEAQCGGGWSR